MLGKLAVLLQSKAAVAVLGVVLVGGAGGVAAAAATGHLPVPHTAATSAQNQSGQNKDQDKSQGQHEVSLTGVLQSYDAAKHTITVLGEHGAGQHDVATTGATTGDARDGTPEASPDATHGDKPDSTATTTDATPTTFTVDGQTKVNGDHASALVDLAKATGHTVQVQAEKQGDGTLLARKVTVQGQGGEGNGGDQHGAGAIGKVASLGADSFVVTGEDGKPVTVTVTAQTAFYGSVRSFSDLKVGDEVAVTGAVESVGSLAATRVIAVANDGRSGSGSPHGEVDVRGSVVSVGAGSFVVKDASGRQVTVTVAPTTQFFGDARSLSDLKAGQSVEAAGTGQADGSVSAALVAVRGAAGD